MFGRVLVAVDNSENSHRLTEAIVRMAHAGTTEFVLLNAFSMPVEFTGIADNYSTTGPILGGVRDALRDQAESTLEGFSRIVGETNEKKNVTIREVVVEDVAGPAIIDACEEYQCNAILMGRRGLGAIKSLLLGSVSDYVIRHSTRPVIIIP